MSVHPDSTQGTPLFYKRSLLTCTESPTPFKTYKYPSDEEYSGYDSLPLLPPLVLSEQNKSSEKAEAQCRICYEAASDFKSLERYCACLGSVEYSHEVCLKEWLETKFPDIEASSCELCNIKYSVSVVKKSKLKALKGKAALKKVCLAAYGFMSLILLALVIFLLLGIYQNSETSEKLKAQALVFIVLSGLAAASLIGIIAIKLRRLMFEYVIINWKLVPSTPPQMQDLASLII